MFLYPHHAALEDEGEVALIINNNMEKIIRKEDIDLVTALSIDSYPTLSMNGVVPVNTISEFKDLQIRLKAIADFFKAKYDGDYGVFSSERSGGNPIGLSGKLRHVWSGVYKGTTNKQYSAQISFVINTQNSCLDVGFYFGRASSKGLDKDRATRFQNNLRHLGLLLSNELNSNKLLQETYNNLFEIGFQAQISGRRVDSQTWLENLKRDPTDSYILFNLYPNSLGYIDLRAIDSYVSFLMPLMSAFPENVEVVRSVRTKRMMKPLTPEQRAQQAEMRALIGFHGEEYVMEYERLRLSNLNIEKEGCPDHRSQRSDSFGYDIFSSEQDSDLFIEVKTTTRLKSEASSKTFYVSVPEYTFFTNNKSNYKLYRVYDIYGSPEVEIVDLDKLEPQIDGYRFTL